MDVINYLKRRMAMLSLALARVEKTSLNQVSDALGSEGSINETMEQGSMAQNMLNGVVTEEVKQMRWRMYKIMNAADNLKTKIVGYDKDGMPITETTPFEKQKLKKINVDAEDPFDVELVISNDEISKSITEALNNETVVLHKDDEKVEPRKDRYDLSDVEKSDINLGEISFDDMVANMKTDTSIVIDRGYKPKFEIERYTKKLIIRDVNSETKLLEFYISKYPDEFDRKTRLLISEINKIIKNPRSSDILDIKKVAFITYKAIGAANGMEYIYDIKNFHKVVEFNGHYVLKFMATPIVNGKFIMDEYRLEDLENKYKQKTAKKLKE